MGILAYLHLTSFLFTINVNYLFIYLFIRSYHFQVGWGVNWLALFNQIGFFFFFEIYLINKLIRSAELMQKRADQDFEEKRLIRLFYIYDIKNENVEMFEIFNHLAS